MEAIMCGKTNGIEMRMRAKKASGCRENLAVAISKAFAFTQRNAFSFEGFLYIFIERT